MRPWDFKQTKDWMVGPGRRWLGNGANPWLAAVGLVAVLHCYNLHDRWGVWQGVALVNEAEWEAEWRFDVYDGEGRRTESGPADALLFVLERRGLVETARLCSSIFTQCFGRATRC